MLYAVEFLFGWVPCRSPSRPERASTSCLVESEALRSVHASSRSLITEYPEQSKNDLARVSTCTSISNRCTL